MAFVSYSSDFQALLAMILDGLSGDDAGNPRLSLFEDLAPLWPVDLVSATVAALCEIDQEDAVTAHAIESLTAVLDVPSGARMLAEHLDLRPGLARYVGSSASAASLRSQHPQPLLATDPALRLQRRIALCRPARQEFARKHIDIEALPFPSPIPSSGLRWRIRQMNAQSEQRLLFELLTALVTRLSERRRVQLAPIGLSVPVGAVSQTMSRSMPMTARSVSFDAALPPTIDPLAGEGPDEDSSCDDIASFEVEDQLPAVVGSGFALSESPQQPLFPQTPVDSGRSYYFWFQIGEKVEESIELQQVGLPKELVEEGAILDVVLFSFAEGFQISSAAAAGKLRVEANGGAKVVSQPGMMSDELSHLDGLLSQRLFFPVQTPAHAKPGSSLHLRCSIYCNQVLLQSRLVSADVGPLSADVSGLPTESSPARLRSLLDYSLVDTVAEPDALRRITPHKLSVFLNDNPDGTHSFRFFGRDGSKQLRHEANLDRDRLSAQIHRARGELRRVAWGDTGPWRGQAGGQSYRYADLPRAKVREQLSADLIRLAKSGATLYAEIARHLASSVEESFALADLMRTPGFVQISSKVTAAQTVPAALLYDQPLSDNPVEDRLSVCESFVAALESSRPLEECVCFHGKCPSYDRDTVVCPSGFWGFRHFLGMPLTGPNRTEPQPSILYQDSPRMSVGISLELQEFPIHERALRNLRRDLVWQCESSAPKIFQMLKDGKSHVVYFYCHGGESPDLPFLEVGKDEYITPRSLWKNRIRWQDPRPIVFLNGCHTTAVDSQEVMDLVSEFVEIGQASGVIGTEITIFEPMARTFAEGFLAQFFAGLPIGQAVRSARLALLKLGNPLGLAYDPYALATVTLAKR